jgi:hypothetical protein
MSARPDYDATVERITSYFDLGKKAYSIFRLFAAAPESNTHKL